MNYMNYVSEILWPKQIFSILTQPTKGNAGNAGKARWRSVFLWIWHCNLNANPQKLTPPVLLFLAIFLEIVLPQSSKEPPTKQDRVVYFEVDLATG